MEELKKEKKKHNHKATDLLKVSIFFILMLAPFMAVASKCMYVICNKNAKDSYSSKSIYQTFLVNEQTTISDNVLLNLKYKQDYNSYKTNVINNLTYFSYTAEDLGITQIDYDTITKITFRQKGGGYEIPRVLFMDNANTIKANKDWNEDFDMNFMGHINDNWIYSIATITQTILTQNKLDNVFEYATNQLEEIKEFNWAKSTGIYTPIYNMTNGMGIKTNVVPMLLAYWSVLTAIYIVFDLIIWIFTKITHMINAE